MAVVARRDERWARARLGGFLCQSVGELVQLNDRHGVLTDVSERRLNDDQSHFVKLKADWVVVAQRSTRVHGQLFVGACVEHILDVVLLNAPVLTADVFLEGVDLSATELCVSDDQLTIQARDDCVGRTGGPRLSRDVVDWHLGLNMQLATRGLDQFADKLHVHIAVVYELLVDGQVVFTEWRCAKLLFTVRVELNHAAQVVLRVAACFQADTREKVASSARFAGVAARVGDALLGAHRRCA